MRASHPDRPGAVFEQREDIHAGQAPGILVVVRKNLEAVAVVAIQAVLGTKPDEAQVVLDELVHAGLGESLSAGDSGEADVVAVGDGQADEGAAFDGDYFGTGHHIRTGRCHDACCRQTQQGGESRL